ncbi:hypothetical protein [Leptospira kirschneri]
MHRFLRGALQGRVLGRSAGFRPRSIDESKSATANPCVATSQS